MMIRIAVLLLALRYSEYGSGFPFYTVAAADDDYSSKSDPNGYIMYCPCMGRFGNQADHLLGSLAFAHMLDRTLVLPPWPTNLGFIPFDRWFNVNVLKAYHKVISAEEFMQYIAPLSWPDDKRIGFCYQLPYRTSHEDECDLTSGSPFGAFWNYLQVDFDSTTFYNLTYTKEDKGLWIGMYPSDKYPVIAFKGAPASFPVKPDHLEVHKYLWWTDEMVAAATNLIYNIFGDEKYIAVHLRNGEDWRRACQYAVGSTTFMSSPQCTGYDSKENITLDMCFPDIVAITRKIREAVIHTQISNVYILTDHNPFLSDIQSELSDLDVKAVHGDPDIPQYDLIIAAKSELFIGNCASSFTAFAVRERVHILGKPNWFFGVAQAS